MKKKILIVSHAMELGGAERSLIGLLETIDYSEYSVDLFLLRHEGELFSSIPEDVNVLDEISSYTVLARPIKQILFEGHIILALARLYGKLKAYHVDNKIKEKNRQIDSLISLEYSHKYTYRLMPKIQFNTCYDLAISFLTPHYIVANNVNARKKIAWIHTDYSRVRLDISSEMKMWNAYDNIISISKNVTEAFINVFPTLKHKIRLIENILPVKLVVKQSNDFSVTEEMPNDSIRILSIGRYCAAKNFESVPAMCKKIIEKGLNVRWYLIGFGAGEGLIKNQIIKNNMQSKVILLGKKENPYPYLKECDLYVQPSRYEGKSVTVREAQILSKPVVITNYGTANSQLEDGIDGIIVPLEINKCSEEIADLLYDQHKMNLLSNNCHNRDYSNAKEIEKLYELINEN